MAAAAAACSTRGAAMRSKLSAQQRPDAEREAERQPLDGVAAGSRSTADSAPGSKPTRRGATAMRTIRAVVTSRSRCLLRARAAAGRRAAALAASDPARTRRARIAGGRARPASRGIRPGIGRLGRLGRLGRPGSKAVALTGRLAGGLMKIGARGGGMASAVPLSLSLPENRSPSRLGLARWRPPPRGSRCPPTFDRLRVIDSESDTSDHPGRPGVLPGQAGAAPRDPGSPARRPRPSQRGPRCARCSPRSAMRMRRRVRGAACESAAAAAGALSASGECHAEWWLFGANAAFFGANAAFLQPIYYIIQGVNGHTTRAPPGVPRTRASLEPGTSGFSTLRIDHYATQGFFFT